MLGYIVRRVLYMVPVLLGVMAPMMVNPTPDLHRAQGVPKAVLRDAARSPEADRLRRDSVAKVRRLCGELGLLTPTARLLWRRVGLWDDPADPLRVRGEAEEIPGPQADGVD